MIERLGRLRRTIPAPGWMAIALVAGFTAGIAAGPGATAAIRIAQLVGNLWIDGLKMTILPLIAALIVTSMATLARGGVAGSSAGSVIGRRLSVLMIALPLAGIVIAIVLGPMLLALHPLPPEVAAGLRAGYVAAPPAPTPAWDEMIRSFVPVNVFASAAAGALIPLVIFAALLGLALGRIDPTRAAGLLAPFAALAEAMTMIVGWVLRVAVLGIFGLAFAIGATAGLGAVAALGHYIFVQVAVSLVLIALIYVVVAASRRVPLSRFARAVAPAQAVAAGTQSSVASLPAMLASAERIGIAPTDAGVILPLAVAVFKVSAGSGTIVSSLGAAWMAGVPIGPAHLIAAIPIALLATFTVLGVPGPGSVLAATTPVALALGAPVELLIVTLAVDTVPDMFRTTANVTADVAVAAIAAPPVTPLD